MSVLTEKQLMEYCAHDDLHGGEHDLLDTIADLQAQVARANETADAKVAAAIAPLQAAVDAFFDAAARAHDQSADASRALAEQIRKARLEEHSLSCNRGGRIRYLGTCSKDNPCARRAELSREP